MVLNTDVIAGWIADRTTYEFEHCPEAMNLAVADYVTMVYYLGAMQYVRRAGYIRIQGWSNEASLWRVISILWMFWTENAST